MKKKIGPSTAEINEGRVKMGFYLDGWDWAEKSAGDEAGLDLGRGFLLGPPRSGVGGKGRSGCRDGWEELMAGGRI